MSPLVDFYSIRVEDPRTCSEFYGTIPSGYMRISTCILKKHANKIKGTRPTKLEWRKYGTIQRYLVPKENVEPCIVDGKKTLCPLNESGKNDLDSIIKQTKGSIVKMDVKEIIVVEKGKSKTKRIKSEPYEYYVMK